MLRSVFRGWGSSDSEGDDSEEDEWCCWRLWRGSGLRELPSPTRSAKSCTPRRRPVLSRGAPRACAAGLFLIGATVFAGISLSPKPPPSTSSDAKPAGMTAEELLGSSQILSVAASSLTALLQVPAESLFWSSDEANSSRDTELFVQGAVRSTFQNVSSSMQHHGHLAQELDSFSLTEGQLKAFVSILEHLADPRVQDLGLAVAKALDHYFQGGVTGEQDVKLLLLQATQPRIVEIRELWHEVNLGALHGPGLGWGVAVNPANLFVLQSFGQSATSATYQPRQKEHSPTFWVAAATFEQARVLLLHLEAHHSQAVQSAHKVQHRLQKIVANLLGDTVCNDTDELIVFFSFHRQ